MSKAIVVAGSEKKRMMLKENAAEHLQVPWPASYITVMLIEDVHTKWFKRPMPSFCPRMK